MRVLVDTNVVCRLQRATHPSYEAASRSVERLMAEGNDLALVPQVIYEYWAVATRGRAENGLGYSIAEAQLELQWLKSIFPILRDERRILEPWEALVVANQVRGKSSHDARLVAAMHRHGLTHLLTFNGDDFRRFGEIEIIDPANAQP